MKYTAVIFDLFGTLIDNFSVQEYERTLLKMADALSVSPRDFAGLWRETFNDRMSGRFGTEEDNIEHICMMLGAKPPADSLKLAVEIRFDLTRRALAPRSGAVETLSALKAAGRRIGLVTDCTAEVPTLWPATPFASLVDVPVFSCAARMKKPDPRIYLLACERLEVSPGQCLYVGDGSSRELTGATEVGMKAVMIRVPYETTDMHRIDAEEWNGLAISALNEVLALLE